MNSRIAYFLLLHVLLSTVLIALPTAHAQDIRTTGDVRQWVIESEGTATTSPDVVYLMMKMEYHGAKATDSALPHPQAVDPANLGSLLR